MNYYIDFDSTLYNTSGLTEAMLKALSSSIHIENQSLSELDMYNEAKKLFNHNNIYNIFELCRYFAKNYNLDANKLISDVNLVIDNGTSLVYEDSVDFLKTLKSYNHKIHLLTYSSQESLDYQMRKIQGSDLVKYIDNLIITSTPKWQLDLNYSNGVFVDDSPSDLIGLYNQHALEVIRIKRNGNQYSLQPLPDNINIQEVKSLLEIKIGE